MLLSKAFLNFHFFHSDRATGATANDQRQLKLPFPKKHIDTGQSLILKF